MSIIKKQLEIEDQIKLYEQKKELIQNTPVPKLNAVAQTGKRVKVWETIYDDNFLMSDLVKAAIIKDIDNMIAEYKAIKDNTDS